MKARLSGVGFLLFAAACAFLVFGLFDGPGLGYTFRGSRAVIAIPFCGATGLWLLVFGYPVKSDGLAPGWWRLGLLATVIGATVATCVAVD